jgi:diaminopimelate epimerase
MRLAFTKMHGAGNDFVVIDAVRQQFSLPAELIRQLGHRHLGVGFDQLLIVEPATQPENDFRYRIFNNDGEEVEQCGNGARCFARFVHDSGLSDKRELRVETARGVIIPRLTDDGHVTVNMGPPRFRHVDIPFVAAHAVASDATANRHQLAIDSGGVTLSVVSMGNPHGVRFLADLQAAPLALDGPRLERHPAFPARANIGYAAVRGKHDLELRVWERGSGETLACGSGACAAAVCGIQQGLLMSPVSVSTRGGTLVIAWAGLDEPVFMTGPATRVFEGFLDLPDA